MNTMLKWQVICDLGKLEKAFMSNHMIYSPKYKSETNNKLLEDLLQNYKKLKNSPAFVEQKKELAGFKY